MRRDCFARPAELIHGSGGECAQRVHVASSQGLDESLEKRRRCVLVGLGRAPWSVETGFHGRWPRRRSDGINPVLPDGPVTDPVVTDREVQVEQRCEGTPVLEPLDERRLRREPDRRPIGDVDLAHRGCCVQHLGGRHGNACLAHRMHETKQRREKERRVRGRCGLGHATIHRVARSASSRVRYDGGGHRTDARSANGRMES